MTGGVERLNNGQEEEIRGLERSMEEEEDERNQVPVMDREPLDVGRLGTLAQTVGSDRASSTLARIEEFEQDRERAARALGRRSLGR